MHSDSDAKLSSPLIFIFLIKNCTTSHGNAQAYIMSEFGDAMLDPPLVGSNAISTLR